MDQSFIYRARAGTVEMGVRCGRCLQGPGPLGARGIVCFCRMVVINMLTRMFDSIGI